MAASVEAPFTLLEEPIAIVLLDAVKFPQLLLGLIQEVLNTVHAILEVCKQL